MITLLEEKRGDQDDLEFLDEDTVMLRYTLPWQEVVTDLNDKIKSISAGASICSLLAGQLVCHLEGSNERPGTISSVYLFLELDASKTKPNQFCVEPDEPTPHHNTPRLASSRLVSPCLALPCLALPCLATPCTPRYLTHATGYASLNYIDAGFRAAKLVKVDILINKEPVDALSFICEKRSVRERATGVVGRLKDNIDRQQFEVVIQVCTLLCCVDDVLW